LPDSQGTADFLGNYHPPQIVNATDNACCFHTNSPLNGRRCRPCFLCRGYYLSKKKNYVSPSKLWAAEFAAFCFSLFTRPAFFLLLSTTPPPPSRTNPLQQKFGFKHRINWYTHDEGWIRMHPMITQTQLQDYCHYL